MRRRTVVVLCMYGFVTVIGGVGIVRSIVRTTPQGQALTLLSELKAAGTVMERCRLTRDNLPMLEANLPDTAALARRWMSIHCEV